MAGRIFPDEEVLQTQNEVRRYHEQRIHDGDVDDKMQRRDGSGSDTFADKPRRDFVQNDSADARGSRAVCSGDNHGVEKLRHALFRWQRTGFDERQLFDLHIRRQD